MTINLSDSLGKIRNYVLEFDIAILNADLRYMGGLEFGFSQTVDAPLTDDRGIRLVWDSLSLVFDAQKRACAFGGARMVQQFCTLTQKSL